MNTTDNFDYQENYRQNIIDATILLKNMHSDMMNQLVNVAMNGEYSDINELFDVGEVIDFNIDYFRPCNDVNVRKLVRHLDLIRETRDFLVNVNCLGEEELEEQDEEDDIF